MIEFEKSVLPNGLTVITHQDTTSPMAAVNVLYKVGSRNESPDHTGFAHLFEHLMFGGSENVIDFDSVIQEAGGENNAFTNSDYTNFYDTLPVENIESALWVEADRMSNLIISKESLDIQRKVVVEEFKEVCLNTPYGDAWHHLSSMCYYKHPYNWPTIGKMPEHIDQATIEDVSHFYQKYYSPQNAILSIASSLSHTKMKELATKWFEEIESTHKPFDKLPTEPLQKEKRQKNVTADVPVKSLFMAFPMPDRLHRKFYICDLLSDLLASGKSSRLYHHLVKKKPHFSSINAYISGTFDPGLFIIEGHPMPEIDMAEAKKLIWEEVNAVKNGEVSDREITKLKNKLTTEIILSNLDILNKAMVLSFFEALGDAGYANTQIDHYNAITKEDVSDVASEILVEERLNELIYLPSQNN
ncbi:MAG: pitrilysin family protein [Saprospiraceae bacterium]